MTKIEKFRGSLSPSESRLFTRLNSPAKIQDYLNTIPFNHEENGETYMSPRRTIQAGTAHCFEGALLAAAALMYHDQKPLIMDLQAARGDTDHVVAIFKQGGRWGAISKTNHGVLRYREPVYATVRELALSYFHEYFLQVNGKKTLRAYSQPFDLSKYKPSVWFAAEDELVDIVNDLEDSIHYPIVTGSLIKRLRKADAIEVLMATHEEFPKKRK